MAVSIQHHRIIDLHEREARLFPREELFDAYGKSQILPETRALSAIELRELTNGLELRALGLIGYLPLTTTLVLNLKPKFPVQNLWRMLSIADETYEKVLPVLRTYENSSTSAPHQLLARSFCYHLREIVTKGIARGYYYKEHRGHFKPKMNFGQTASRFLSRGDNLNVAADTFAFSANLLANRAIKAACLDFLPIVPRTEAWLNEHNLLIEALDALRLLKAERQSYDDHFLADTIPSWLRSAYRGALTTQAVFLGYTNVGFPYDARGSEMPSFLFSLDAVFENFIRNSLRFEMRKSGISVVDGNKNQHQLSLFIDNKRFPTKPDIILSKNKKIWCIGEVKYKPRINEADRYQLISHVVAASVPLGVWISPALSSADAGLEYIGTIPPGARFFHYRLNLSGDLDAARIKMAFDIASLIS